VRGEGDSYWEWRPPGRQDFGLIGLAVRFLVSVAALWFAQLIVPGFDIEGVGPLVFGAVIFGLVNALIRPVVAFFTCWLTCLTLGLFTLIINTAMLALTAWIAGQLDLAFEVDDFIAAFLGALVIAVVSTVLNWWASANVFGGRRW
jgi:putative membrane protein